MNDVTEGPAMNEFRREDEVTPEQAPFAYKLARALGELGVAVQAHEPLVMGAKINSNGFVQLHVSRDRPDALAQEIERRFGRSVQFGELAIPRNGVVYVAWSRSNEVWVRHVVAYQVQTDSLMQRWDVLVRVK